MIRPIVHMETFLRRPSSEASVEDLPLAQDLIDTLNTHRDACVGMAANMIGALKRVIVFVDETGAARVLFNPRLVEGTGAYRTREGCLSLAGERETSRFSTIRVAYQEPGAGALVSRVGTWHGFVADIIQHEIDHCDGVLI